MTIGSGIHKTREMARLNKRSIGASVLKNFIQTTQYGTLFGQVEKLIQDFFDAHLSSWDISSVNGSPSLVLDFQNVDFAQAEMPPQGIFTCFYLDIS